MIIRWPTGDCHTIAERRKLHDDLLDQGETCCPNRVARLATLAGIKAQIGTSVDLVATAASRPWWWTTRWVGSSTWKCQTRSG